MAACATATTARSRSIGAGGCGPGAICWGGYDRRRRKRSKARLKRSCVSHAPPDDPTPTDSLLAQAPCEYQSSLRELLADEARSELAELYAAPIIINWNPHPDAQPLAMLRRARRGVGDHALTLIRSEHGMA